MLKNKQLVLLFMIFSAGISPMLQADIFSDGIEYFKNRFSTLPRPNTETLKIAVTAFTLGSVGTFLFNNLKKKHINTANALPQNSVNEIDFNPTIQDGNIINKAPVLKSPIEQLNTLSQGYSADCGYYALWNGLTARNLHNQKKKLTDAPEFVDQKKLQKDLSIWKKEILIHRNKKALKLAIEKELKKHLACPHKEHIGLDGDDDLCPAYQRLLPNIGIGIADYVYEKNETLTIDQTYIHAILKEQLSDSTMSTNLDTYFPTIAELKIKVNPQSYQFARDTDWLQSGEIRTLAEQELGRNYHKRITVLDSEQQIKDFKGITFTPNKDNYHILVLGNMNEANLGSIGHWTLMMAVQDKKNNLSFYTANSLNQDITNDPNVKHVQRTFQPFTRTALAAASVKQYPFKQYNYLVGRNDAHTK